MTIIIKTVLAIFVSHTSCFACKNKLTISDCIDLSHIGISSEFLSAINLYI